MEVPTPVQRNKCCQLVAEAESQAIQVDKFNVVFLIRNHNSICPTACSQVARLAGMGISLLDIYMSIIR